MVQNSTGTEPKRRGRPPAYDTKVALKRATDAFWKAGYAGTSLDAITAATGMNKPSLYAAFGDKHALYLESLALYWQHALAALRKPLAEARPLDEALTRVYDGALSIYFSGDGRPRGCFMIGTAVTEAVEDRAVRNSVATAFRTFDQAFEERFRAARDKGELKADADPAGLAALATATMHTIAIRARAGASRAELEELARKAVRVLCA